MDSIFLGGGGEISALSPLPLIRLAESKLSEDFISLHRISRSRFASTREFLSRPYKKKRAHLGSFLLGGGGEIRTPAPDLSRLTI